MILLLGATGYVGQAFANGLRRRKGSFIPLSRNALDYTQFEVLFDYVRKVGPEFVINAAEEPRKEPNGFGGAEAEIERMEMLRLNVLLPQTVARVCEMTNTPWGHLSSGSIYSGSKIFEDGRMRVEPELGSRAVRRSYGLHPERFFGFTELDEPNFTFKFGCCTFYSGTKALAEEAIQHYPQKYTWRIHLPFNEHEDPRNFLSQLREGSRPHDALNSLSHLDDCVGACLELWERRAPFGVYNVVNPGVMQTHEILASVHRFLKPRGHLQILVYEDEPQTGEQKAPNPNCILDGSKLLNAGIKLRTATEALQKALERWPPERSSIMKNFA